MTGTISLASGQFSVGERDGFVLVPIRRTGDLSGVVNIDYAVTGDTAVDGFDFRALEGVIRLESGQSSVNVRIPILNDAVAEPSELLVLSILDLDSGTLLAPRTARITILDDETPITPPVEPPRSTPYRVSFQTALTGLDQPIRFEFFPGSQSQILLAEKGGVIRTANLTTGVTGPALLDLSARTNEAGDRGLMDIALHPDFARNPYLYAFVVIDPEDAQGNTGLAGPDGGGNRYAQVLRWTLETRNGALSVVAGSETILAGSSGRSLADISGRGAIDSTSPQQKNLVASDILDNRNPADPVFKRDYIKVDSLSHAGGGLAFGPDGKLYVSIGDGASFNYADRRALSVQDRDSLAGKILRIDPLTGQGLADNPFATADLGSAASRIYQLGSRNPFSISFLPDGRLISSETGWYSWEELNVGGKGANFGWPFYEGGDNGIRLVAPGYSAFAESAAFRAAVAAGTIPLTEAYRAFAHDRALPGFAMQAITGGDVVYDGNRYPAAFANDYFFADVSQGQIYTVDANDRQAVQWIAPAPGGFGPVHFTQGPDGYVYAVDLVGGNVFRVLISDRSASSVPRLQFSLDPGRDGASDLAGTVLGQDAYVFATNPGSINSVSFWLDDPGRTGTPRQVERLAPWDFLGADAAGRPRILDIDALAEGRHEITALVRYANGTSGVISSVFTIDRPDPQPEAPVLQFSANAQRGSAQALADATLRQDVYVFASDRGNATSVAFWLDDPGRTGAARQVERLAPWDFAGSGATGVPRVFDIDSLAEGRHEITALVTFADGTTRVLSSAFTIDRPGGLVFADPADLV